MILFVILGNIEEAEFYEYLDLHSIVSLVKPDVLERLLNETKFDKNKTKFLVDGFKFGFDLCYEGLTSRQSKAKNLPFTVGNKVILWNKIMKEVKCRRMAGPFKTVPFQDYIQLPIGFGSKKWWGPDKTDISLVL